MRYILIVLLFLINVQHSLLAQDLSVTVARLKNGSAFIETSRTSDVSSILGNTRNGIADFPDSKTSYPSGSIWVDSQTLITIQNGIRKAIDWAKNNEVHKMEFTKEIVRFRTMDKELYTFHKMYISEFSSEGKLVFEGYTNGSFTLNFKVDFFDFNVTLTTVKDLQAFLSLLQGKSANKEVDEIFHTP